MAPPTTRRPRGTMSSPTGVFIYSGVLYVSDRNNHRVLLFQE